jgi:penicillin amidase
VGTAIVAPGLKGPVDVVRDVYGIPHIHAETLDDLAFANGYVMAADRLVQMNVFRHAASGRLAEIFGGLREDVIDGDIEMRAHRLRPLAEAAWAELEASGDPTDREIVTLATRFADGVNHFIQELRDETRFLDSNLSTFADPANLEAWTPADSLVIGRLQTKILSYDEGDLGLTAAAEKAQERMGPSRRHAFHDLHMVMPMALASTLNGFPNVPIDRGTRAKPSRGDAPSLRPHVPVELLSAAQATHAASSLYDLGLAGSEVGSNNWIVGPKLAGGGTLLANDPHLRLSNPSVWYAIQLTVPGQVDVLGVTFPGLPGVLLGRNAHFAWGATVVSHDVTDFYLETIEPCASGQGDCVKYKNGLVPIETWQETIRIGTLGDIKRTLNVTYESVPHHGTILPTIVDHDVVPRATGMGISVKYTGDEVTHEVRAFYQLNRAKTVADGFAALEHMSHGAMNWVMIDDQGGHAYSSNARVPWRSAGCFSYHETNNPDGVAPFFVVSGDGSCEWEGWMDPRYIPHATSPDKGYLATANQDPIGETFDGDALNGPMVDGRPLYLQAYYDPGFRLSRIIERLEAMKAEGRPLTREDMAAIQADTRSNYGAVMRPHVVKALAALAEEIAVPDTHPGLAAFAKGLSSERRAKLAAAQRLLEAWTLATPPAVGGSPAQAEIDDSVATSIFNAWAVVFFSKAFGDERELMDAGFDSDLMARLGLSVFARPGALRSGMATETDEPVVCDDLGTEVVESCTLLALVALDQALAWAESADGFGSADMATWRWGKRHTVTLPSLVPLFPLDVPSREEGGVPRPGDQFAVDASNNDYNDFVFTYGAGASMRHVTEFAPGKAPVTIFALPGGEVYDTGSKHYRDLFDTYWSKNEYFVFPSVVAEIRDKAEEHWRLLR